MAGSETKEGRFWDQLILAARLGLMAVKGSILKRKRLAQKRGGKASRRGASVLAEKVKTEGLVGLKVRLARAITKDFVRHT